MNSKFQKNVLLQLNIIASEWLRNIYIYNYYITLKILTIIIQDILFTCGNDFIVIM